LVIKFKIMYIPILLQKLDSNLTLLEKNRVQVDFILRLI